MQRNLSQQAVQQYLPAIKAVYASTEVGLARYADLKTHPRLRVIHLHKEFGSSAITHAMSIMSLWLSETAFDASAFYFTKRTATADWGELLPILHAKIAEYEGSTLNILVALSPSGTISREIAGETFSHNLKDDGFKVDIIKRLMGGEGYVSTAVLRAAVKSKSDPSVLKTIAKINTILKNKLHLPIDKKFIDTKRGLGHRINPVYTVVLLKKG